MEMYSVVKATKYGPCIRSTRCRHGSDGQGFTGQTLKCEEARITGGESVKFLPSHFPVTQSRRSLNEFAAKGPLAALPETRKKDGETGRSLTSCRVPTDVACQVECKRIQEVVS